MRTLNPAEVEQLRRNQRDIAERLPGMLRELMPHQEALYSIIESASESTELYLAGEDVRIVAVGLSIIAGLIALHVGKEPRPRAA